MTELHHDRYDTAAMIRFQCASCQQPIEIDDEWALKAVACPYCRKTVTAPATSTIGQDDEIPLAAPLAPGAATPATPVPPAGFPDYDATDPLGRLGDRQASAGNPIAIVALALMLSAIVCLLVVVVIAAEHPAELTALTQRVEKAGSAKQQFEAMMSFFDEQGGMPTWLIGFSLAQMGCLMLTLGALICGLLGLRRPAKHGLAAIAAAVSGGLLLLLCSGMVF